MLCAWYWICVCLLLCRARPLLDDHYHHIMNCVCIWYMHVMYIACISYFFGYISLILASWSSALSFIAYWWQYIFIMPRCAFTTMISVIGLCSTACTFILGSYISYMYLISNLQISWATSKYLGQHVLGSVFMLGTARTHVGWGMLGTFCVLDSFCA